MKKLEITIVINVDDDVTPDDVKVYDHDVCDGLEIILSGDSDKFRMSGFALNGVKEIAPLKMTDEDILAVAKRLEITLTGNQLNWVKLSYDDSQKQDPTATWNLIVEDLLYMLKTNFEG